MRVHRVRIAFLVSLLLLGGAEACRQDTPSSEDEAGVAADTYVQVMAELMFLDAGPPAGVAADAWEASLDSLRSEILSSHGVTAPEILEFAGAAGSEAGRMEVLWKAIAEKYDSMRVERLRLDTEARSELEGKLGRDAPIGAAAESTATTARPASGSKLLRRPAGRRPVTRDTTPGSR